MLTRGTLQKAGALLHDYAEPHNFNPSLSTEPAMQFKGLVTRSSNGTIELAGVDGAAVPRDIEQGAEVDVTIEIVRNAKQIEEETAQAKIDRGATPRRATVDTENMPASAIDNLPEDVRPIGRGTASTPASERKAPTPATPATPAKGPAKTR